MAERLSDLEVDALLLTCGESGLRLTPDASAQLCRELQEARAAMRAWLNDEIEDWTEMERIFRALLPEETEGLIERGDWKQP